MTVPVLGRPFAECVEGASTNIFEAATLILLKCQPSCSSCQLGGHPFAPRDFLWVAFPPRGRIFSHLSCSYRSAKRSALELLCEECSSTRPGGGSGIGAPLWGAAGLLVDPG